MTRAKRILLLVLTIGICLVGCRKKDGAGQDKRLTIAVIPKGTIHEFWKTVHAGAEKAGQEMNVEVLWKGSLKEDDREAQISVVENIITRKVDGIVLAPLDDAALRRPVDEAMRSGIPVVIFDSGLQGDNYISYVATDNFKAGQLAGKFMAELLDGNGKVAVLRYLKATENLLFRFGGAEGRLGIDGIFCATEPTTLGILRGLQNAGYAGKVKFVGFDSSETMIAALRAGALHGFVVQDPMQIGYLGVRTMVRHIRGEPVPRRIDTGSTLVTKENLEDPDVHELLTPNLSKWLK